MSVLLDRALQYAGRGWHVFPLRPRGKLPIVAKRNGGNGFYDATTDRAQIVAWWTQWPDANIGLATGASGLTVLDIDGPEGLALYQKVAGDRPPTLAAKTGRAGGLHVYYRGAVPSSQVKGEHLDVRGSTGYVVAPPSIHETGNAYAWLDPLALIADLPAWVAPWVAARGGPAAPHGPDMPPRPAYLGAGVPLADRLAHALQEPFSEQEASRLRAALATIPPDIDGKTWVTIGAALHDLNWIINGSDLAFEIWDEWSAKSTGQGVGNGQYKGRADLAKRWKTFDKKTKGTRATVGTVFALAKKYGWAGQSRTETVVNSTISGEELNKKPSEHVNGAVLTLPEALTRANAIHFPDTDKNGYPKQTCKNARAAIAGIAVDCRHDTFHGKMLVGGHVIDQWAGELSDDALQMLRVVIDRQFGFDPGLVNVHDAAVQECLQQPFDPVADYLDALQWDGVQRVRQWLARYLGAEDNLLHQAIGVLALVAAVRRVRQPGIKFDQILVLESGEGRGKSTAIEILAGGDNFSDQSILTLDDKGQQEAMQGVWIYEIADMAGMSRADVERVKAFASRKVDRARPAYGRARVDRPRRCVFWATTNDESYLKSQTGNRRFWPVSIGHIDLEGIKRDRDQLWAEASLIEARGVSLFLPEGLWQAAGAEQAKRLEQDPWDDLLDIATGKIFETAAGPEERISSRDLLDKWLRLPADKQGAVTAKRLVYVMRRLGWAGPKPWRDGVQVSKGYSRKPVTL